MVPPPVSQPGVTNNATTAIDANAPVAVSGVSVDALAAAGIDVAVDPQTVIASLQRANRTTAATAVSELRARIEATTRALNELRTEAKATGMQVDGALLEQATADLRSQENMLRQALTNASRASNDAEWRQAQAQLATQYQLYAQAVRRTQTILGR